MKRVVRLTVALLRDWLRNREAVFFAVLFPVILLVIFSLVFGGGASEFTIHVQNNDIGADGEPTNLSATFVTALEGVDTLEVKQLESGVDPTAAVRERQGTDAPRVLIIPEGFAADVRNQSARVRMQVITDTLQRMQGNESGTDSSFNTSAMEQANLPPATPVEIRFITAPDDDAAGAVESILHSVVTRFNQRAMGVEQPIATVRADRFDRPGVSAADYFLPGFIGAIIVINGVMTLPSLLAGYKSDGTLKRLVSTPLQKWEWIVANVVQQAILAVALTFLLIGVAWLFFGVRAIPGPIAIGLVLLAAVGFAAVGMVVGNVLNSPDSAISLGGAIAFPMMFLSGVFWDVGIMPASVQALARFMPLYYFRQTLLEVLILDSTENLLMTTGILAALAGIALVVAVVSLNWENLDG